MGKETHTRAAIIAALISNLIFGLSFMASRIALEHTSSAIMLSLRFGASVLIMLLPVLYLSLLSSVVAFGMLNYSVTYLDAAKVTVFSNIIPVVSLVAGVLVLGEPFSAVYLVGVVLILLGVYKVNAETGRE